LGRYVTESIGRCQSSQRFWNLFFITGIKLYERLPSRNLVSGMAKDSQTGIGIDRIFERATARSQFDRSDPNLLPVDGFNKPTDRRLPNLNRPLFQ
jgi:hypothetical protein